MTTSGAVPPTQSYIIWFSQRVGSTMLAQALEDTGIAGRPREWFNAADAEAVLAAHGASDMHELRETLWREGTTANGVWAVKYGMTERQHESLTALFAGLVPGVSDPDGRAAWDALFPRCRHVFMTRRDKLRLAVSWWRAIKSQEWHRPNRPRTVLDDGSPWTPPVPPPAAGLDEQYDGNALAHLLVETNLREAAMQELFDRWGVVPHTVVYEDFIASYEPTVRGVLEFLEVPGRETVEIQRPAFDRLADEVSERWYRRFRREGEELLR